MRLVKTIRFLQDNSNKYTRVEYTNGEVEWFISWATMEQLSKQSISKIINKVQIDRFEKEYGKILDKRVNNVNFSLKGHESKEITVFQRTPESLNWFMKTLEDGFTIVEAKVLKFEEGIIQYKLIRPIR
jgi:hypothetical protein